MEDKFGPDCMCPLCMKYGWHDSAPLYTKVIEFIKRVFNYFK